MAKGFERKEYQKSRGMEYATHPDAVTIRKLGEIVSDMYLSTDESDHRRMWASASRLLAQTKADKERVAAIMQSKRIGALSTLVNELQKEMLAPKVGRSAAAAASAVEPIAGSKPAAPSAAHAASSAANLHGDQPASHAASSEPKADAPGQPSDAEMLKQAMKAFRKRLKLTKLDEESRLGNRAMTGGRKSSIIAIMPPREYPRSVWEELARQGKLKGAGNGFFELVE